VINLTVGNFNYKELEDLLFKELNNVLGNSDAGFMLLRKIINNIVNLQWSTSNNNIINFTNLENITGDNTNGYNETGGSNTEWNGWLMSNIPFIEGSGGFQFVVKAYQLNTSFVIGMTDEIKEIEKY